MTATLTESGVRLIVRDMLTLHSSIDLYLDELERRGYSPRTLEAYTGRLWDFADEWREPVDVSEITLDDINRHLHRHRLKAANTRFSIESALVGFFDWLWRAEKIAENPTRRLVRSRRLRPEDLDVKTIGVEDVARLLAAALPGRERLTIAVLAYTGVRRKAAANLRITDYDRERGLLRFVEKGPKVIWKPIPHQLRNIIEDAIDQGHIKPPPDDYLIPPQGKTQKAERASRIILETVKAVAGRAGIDPATVHCHAIRAAFAVQYASTHNDDVLGLQDLMGHAQTDTTRTYLRRRDKQKAMERVRDLSWEFPPQTGQSPEMATPPTAKVTNLRSGR